MKTITLFKKINRFKPLYKKFINLRENVQNRKKLLFFKKKKWEKFIFYAEKKLKRYNKYKPQDQLAYLVFKHPSRGNSYKKGRHRNILQSYKKFKLFYGDLNKKKIKYYINKIKNKKTKDIKTLFLKQFENRLDTILYRTKFCKSIRTARQLIIHGKVLINDKKIKSQSYNLNSGDLISIDKTAKKIIERNIANSLLWPIPPKNLIINYKTLQIVFCTLDNNVNIGTYYHFNLNLEKLLLDYK